MIAWRERHFKDYRIRIGRTSADPEVEAHAQLCVDYLEGEPASRAGAKRFRSVYRGEKYLTLSPSRAASTDPHTERRVFDIIRDYTMYDWAEAPQDYPAVAHG